MRPLAERLKFDSGLTIGQHAVTLQKPGARDIAALVTIPVRGAPRLQVMGAQYLTTYRVIGDSLEYVGSAAAYVYADQFNAATANPVTKVAV
jgi:hypothetical protein